MSTDASDVVIAGFGNVKDVFVNGQNTIKGIAGELRQGVVGVAEVVPKTAEAGERGFMQGIVQGLPVLAVGTIVIVVGGVVLTGAAVVVEKKTGIFSKSAKAVLAGF